MNTRLFKIILAGMIFLIFPFTATAVNDVTINGTPVFQFFTTDTAFLSNIQGQNGGVATSIDTQNNYMDITLDNGSNITFTTTDPVYFKASRISGSGYTISPSCLRQTVTLSSTANAVIRIEVVSTPPSCTNMNTNGGGGNGTPRYHMSCFQNACIRAAGDGTDECSTFLDCIPLSNANTNGGQSNTNGAPNNNTNSAFTDIQGHWAESYINSLNSHCDIEGYKDENGNPLFLFKPDNSISRAELVRILIYCQYGPLSTPDENPFPDVDRNSWYGPYIDKALELGWINGYKDKYGRLINLFRPNQYINRAEATKIIVLSQYVLDQVSGGHMGFFDTFPGSWYEPFIAFAHGMLFVDGYLNPDGTPTGYFGPQNNLTRGEAAKIIHNVKGW